MILTDLSTIHILQYFVAILPFFQLTFTFYATCPTNSCGRDLDPPRGQCLFGGCSCNLPWTGDDCAVELLAPVVETPADVQVAEGSAYEHQLVLTQVNGDTYKAARLEPS